MERTEPTFVPEWLKSSGGLSTSHQSSSLHPDEQGVSKTLRNKSLDNELRTTSSYFRRTSISNGSALSRSYSSFGRNNRDRDWDKDNRHRDYSDPLGNILPSRFEKEGLRRSFSSVSGKRGESWPRKVASDLSIANKSSLNNGGALLSGGGSVKTSFERDFPSLGTDEKPDLDIGRVPSPGLSSAIQSLPIGNSAVIGGDGWTSALAEVPVIVGSNGNATSALQPASIPATTSMTGGRNMAETLAHGPPRTQAAPQLTVGTQRLEELAVKQSRQLIPMTPSMPKALALNSDKPKLKVGQHPHSPRPVSVKPDVSKTSNVGKLLVLKPSRERNGITPTTKESLSPTGAGGKLPNSPLAVPSVPSRNPNNTTPPLVVVEKRPSSQAQSRNNFFNLMRKKSMTSNSNNSSVAPDTGSSGEKSGGPVAAPPPPEGGGDDESTGVEVEQSINGGAVVVATDNGKNHSGLDGILYSEEEEARFLRSLGWDETAEEEEGLTEEEISSFYRNYLTVKPASKFLKGIEPKLMMPIHSQMGEVSSNSKVDG